MGRRADVELEWTIVPLGENFGAFGLTVQTAGARTWLSLGEYRGRLDLACRQSWYLVLSEVTFAAGVTRTTFRVVREEAGFVIRSRDATPNPSSWDESAAPLSEVLARFDAPEDGSVRVRVVRRTLGVDAAETLLECPIERYEARSPPPPSRGVPAARPRP